MNLSWQNISGKILILLAGFSIGFLCFGIRFIGEDTLGVKRDLWSCENMSILDTGIYMTNPLLSRISLVPLNGNIKMGYYKLGNFITIKQIESLSSDNYVISLHLSVDYSFSKDNAEKLLRQFDGDLPVPYIEHHIRKIIEDEISRRNRFDFKQKASLNFIKYVERKCFSALRENGFELQTLTFSILNDQYPSVRKPGEKELNRWSSLKKEESRK